MSGELSPPDGKEREGSGMTLPGAFWPTPRVGSEMHKPSDSGVCHRVTEPGASRPSSEESALSTKPAE